MLAALLGLASSIYGASQARSAASSRQSALGNLFSPYMGYGDISSLLGMGQNALADLLSGNAQMSAAWQDSSVHANRLKRILKMIGA